MSLEKHMADYRVATIRMCDSVYERNRRRNMSPAQLEIYRKYLKVDEEQHRLQYLRDHNSISDVEYRLKFNKIMLIRARLQSEEIFYMPRTTKPKRKNWIKEGF